jgi:hypothetical protein
MEDSSREEVIPSPMREAVAEKFRDLIAGRITREQASAWACTWVTRLEDIDDDRVRDGLVSLGMADLITTDRPYLYGPEDFEGWLRDLNS